MKLLIKKNGILYAIIFTGLLMLTTVVFSRYNRHMMAQSINQKVRTDKIVTISGDILIKLQALDQSLRAYVITSDPVFLDEYQSYAKGSQTYQSTFDSLQINFNKQKAELPALKASLDSASTLLTQVNAAFDNYVAFTNQVTDSVKTNQLDNFKYVLAKEDPGNKIVEVWSLFDKKLKHVENGIYQESQAKYIYTSNANSWLQVLMLIIGLPLLGWVIYKMRRDEKTSKQLLIDLELNNKHYIFDSGETDTSFEVKDILSNSIQNFQEAASFVKKVTQGQYDTKWDGLNDENKKLNEETLAGELIKMQEQMLKLKLEDEKRNWTNEGLSALGEVLRRESDLNSLSDKILTALIKYVGANQGSLFIVNNESENNRFLDLISAYAYGRKKFRKSQILPGEGMAGQAWQEGETIYLKEIPQNYLKITSGLGGANPTNILIVPLKNDDDTQGILELASFKIFQPHEIAFVEKIAESIAVSFSNSRVADRTKRLLEETTQMTEELKSQEEEMRQNMEELQATQEEMYRNQRETVQKEANLNALINHTKDAVASIDKDYKILAINNQMKKLYQRLGIDFEVGKNALYLLPEHEIAEKKKEYDRVLAGEQISSKTEIDSVSGVKLYFETTYFPIKDLQSNITGISIFLRNITDDIMMRKTLEDKQSLLEGLINNTEDNILALDREYNVTIINNKYKERYLRMGHQYDIGHNAFDVMDKSIHDEWKAYYDRALGGERFSFRRELKDGEKVILREYSFNPIRNATDDVIGLSIFNRIVSEA